MADTNAVKSTKKGEETDGPLVYQLEEWSYERLEAQRGRAHFLLSEPYRYVSVILIPATRGQPKHLICMDSPCYHAAGPLGEGDLVELEDLVGTSNSETTSAAPSILCIRCPWHRFLVDLSTGEEVLLYPSSDPSEHRKNAQGREGGLVKAFKPRTLGEGAARRELSTSRRSPPVMFGEGEPCQVKRGKRVQRLHKVELDEATHTLTITVEVSNRIPPHALLKSDGPATDLKYGGMCIEIEDIKARGLDRL